jgi:hypothetical protein
MPTPQIISPTDFYRDKAVEYARSTSDRFNNAVRPIYGQSGKGKPEHIGSAIFVRIEGTPLLLTAAHVTDHLSATSLYVASPADLIRVRFKRSMTTNPHMSRDEDRYDFSLMELSDAMLGDLGEVAYVEETSFQKGRAFRHGHVYVACGYPNSKNKKVNNIEKRIHGKMWTYVSTAAEDEALAQKLKISGEEHVFIPFSAKTSYDTDGKKMNSLNPVGISGWALFDLGDFSDVGRLASLPAHPVRTKPRKRAPDRIPGADSLYPRWSVRAGALAPPIWRQCRE